jgi:hypothetical protein
MDNTQLTTAGLTATFTALAAIAYKIFRIINGKKLHSKCCNKDIEIGIQVEDMTPPHIHLPPDQNLPQQFKVNPMNISSDKNG